MLTRTRFKKNLLPELPLILQTRSPCRIISIDRKIETRNNILEQVKICKIIVEDKIKMEESNIILDELYTPWIHNGWALKDASEDLKIDREIVRAAVKQNGRNIKFVSEDIWI